MKLSAFKGTSTLTVAVAVLIALVSTALFSWALSAAASPPNQEDRLSALQERLDVLERTMPSRGSTAYTPNALCEPPLIPAAQTLKEELAARASATSVSVQQLVAAPTGGAGPAPGLAPIDVSLSAEGAYDAIRALLGSLQTMQPEVFVDTVELRPSGDKIQLRMTGRAFCWTSARR